MRLEQENDDLAHELVTSKIALRNDLDQVTLTEMGPSSGLATPFLAAMPCVKVKHGHNIKSIITWAFIFLTTSLVVAVRKAGFPCAHNCSNSKWRLNNTDCTFSVVDCFRKCKPQPSGRLIPFKVSLLERLISREVALQNVCHFTWSCFSQQF